VTKKAAAIASSPLTLLAQGLECAELVERMQGDALHVLRQRVVLGQDVRRSIPHDAGIGAVFASRFCFTSSDSA
jgi:hypothetical protein